MTTNEIGNVIGMVCDKVGLAVDKVQPLAEEVVRQYSQKERLYAVECGIFAVLFFFGSIMGLIMVFLSSKDTTEEGQFGWLTTEEGQFWLLMFGIVTAIICFLLSCAIADMGFTHYGNAIAPLCGLIGK